jgi:hypothetical protein
LAHSKAMGSKILFAFSGIECAKSVLHIRGRNLAEPEKKQSFWTTMPGMLTGIAAVLTAVTGLLVAVYPHGLAGSKDGATVVSPKDSAGAAQSASPAVQDTAPATQSAAGAGSASASVMPKQDKPTVLLIRKDGTETRGFLHGFQDSYSLQSIALKNGQSIPFDKIKSVDFTETHGYDQDVKVMLIDGRALEGDIMAGEQLTGETDIGPFSISVVTLKQVVFEGR